MKHLLSLGSIFVSLVLIGASCSLTPSFGTVPESGTYDLSFESIDSCVGGGNLDASGTSGLYVTSDGEQLIWFIDGQQIVLHQQFGSGIQYVSPKRFFPVQTPTGPATGVVYFDMIANTSDTLIGNMHWDNRIDCTGEYTFSLVQTSSILPPFADVEYDLVMGEWNVDYGDWEGDCEDVAGFSAFDPSNGVVELEHPLDLDNDGEIESEVFIHPPGIFMSDIPGSNMLTSNDAPFDVGVPVDDAGDLNLDYEDDSFEGTFELEIVGDGEIQGWIDVSSSSAGCSMSMPLMLTR